MKKFLIEAAIAIAITTALVVISIAIGVITPWVCQEFLQ